MSAHPSKPTTARKAKETAKTAERLAMARFMQHLQALLRARNDDYERYLTDSALSEDTKRRVASWQNELEHILLIMEDVWKEESA